MTQTMNYWIRVFDNTIRSPDYLIIYSLGFFSNFYLVLGSSSSRFKGELIFKDVAVYYTF